MRIRDDHRHCQELRPILEVAKNAKSSTAIVHIERDLEHIDAAFEKHKLLQVIMYMHKSSHLEILFWSMLPMHLILKLKVVDLGHPKIFPSFNFFLNIFDIYVISKEMVG
jgi:hypothetical protein